MKRRIAVLTVLAAMSTALAVALTPAAAAVGPTCQIDYRVTAQWSTGFTVDGFVTNLGAPVNGWTLAFAFPDPGQVVQLGWAIGLTQTGQQVTGTSLPWTAAIPTGGSIRIGFNGGLSGGALNPVPTAFTVNGAPCSTGPPPTFPPRV